VNSPQEAEELGAEVARKLIDAGGREILELVAKDREQRTAETEAQKAAEGQTASSS
jgi:hypothetical protein